MGPQNTDFGPERLKTDKMKKQIPNMFLPYFCFREEADREKQFQSHFNNNDQGNLWKLMKI